MQYVTTLSEAVTTKPAKMPVQGREPSTSEISSSGDEDMGGGCAQSLSTPACRRHTAQKGMASVNANWSLRVSVPNYTFHVSAH